MATWIGHLRIAEELLEAIDGLDPEQFSIGNLAPDSGLPNENWERFDPPTEVTHCKGPGQDEAEIQDLMFFREHLISDGIRDDSPKFSFLLGYFFHLITDRLWSVEIGQPTKERFATQFAEDPDFIWEVKRDWYGLDHVFLREHPHSLFFEGFQSFEYRESYLDFIPREAIQMRIDEIKTIYSRNDERAQSLVDRPFSYLNKEEMSQFVLKAAAKLEEIHRVLIIDRAEYSGLESSLQLVG